MKIKTKMFYLGKKFVNNEGKKRDDGKERASYFLVRMEDENDNLYEWYVPSTKDNDMMVEVLQKAEKYKEYQVLLELSAYQNKPRIDLVGMAK